MAEEKRYKVKGWEKFQRFKNRRPPWIRLYRSVIDDPDIFNLSAPAFRFLIFLWLMASEDETKQGIIPPNHKIAFRLRTSCDQVQKLLSQVDPMLIPCWDHVACPDNSDNSETDNSDNSETESCAEPPTASAPDPVVVSIPATGKIKEVHITKSKLAEYEATYPGINVLAELRKCRQWNIDNPSRRKTASGMWRHVNTWLSKAQNDPRVPRKTLTQQSVDSSSFAERVLYYMRKRGVSELDAALEITNGIGQDWNEYNAIVKKLFAETGDPVAGIAKHGSVLPLLGDEAAVKVYRARVVEDLESEQRKRAWTAKSRIGGEPESVGEIIERIIA